MASFKDRNDREWRLELDVPMVVALRTRVGFELGKAAVSERFGEILFGDPETLVRVLWVICEQQAEKAGVTPEQFGGGFNGQAVSDAVDALIGAITDFTHRPAVAAAIKAKLPTTLAGMEARMIRAIEEKMNSISNESATSLPASAESIQQA